MFIPIVNTSISASWLILAIIVIRLVFKKMPKAWTCVLWGLVAIRLICPFSIESPLSLIPSAEVIPEEVLYMEGGQRHDPVEFNGIEAPTVQEAVGEAVGETVSQVQIFDVYGSLVWLAGIAAMLLYALISYLRLRHRVMVSINERDNIWLCDQIDSPFILGMFRPRIYMPSGMAEEQAAYVIAHEQAHLQRHDHWWKPFGFLLLAVYWFNPLIWVAYILLARDIELACDEKVIQSMETPDKQAYSEALLVCSVNRRMIAACPLAFGEVGVKARVKSVLNYKKPAFWVVVGSVVICAVVAVCFLTDPAKKDTEALGETVSWIHAPDGVAWHSVLHLDFDMEYSYVETICDNGLMWNLYSDAKETGKAVRFDAGVPVCWTPAWETSGSHPEETEVEFTVYEGDTEAYSGRLMIICAESEDEVATYEVKLVAPDELVMWQKDATFAGVITLNGDNSSVCKHEPGKLIAEEWREVPNPAPSEYKNVEQNWERYICKQCGTEFEVAGSYREMRDDRKEDSVTAFLSEEDFEDPVPTAEKLLSRAFSFDPTNYESEVSQNGDFWNLTFDGEHHYVVELTPKLPYPQTLYEFRRVPPGGYGEVEIPAEGELVDIAEDFLWSAYALKDEDAQIEVVQGEDKICVQFVFSDTAIFHVRIHTGDLKPSGILFFNNLETARKAMEQDSIFQTEEETQEEVQVEEPEPRVEPVQHTQEILNLAVWTVSNGLSRQYHEYTPNTRAMEILQVEVDPAESARAAYSYFERKDDLAVTDAALASQMIAVKAVYHVDWFMETESNRADAGAHAAYYYVMPSPYVSGRWYVHDIVPTAVPEDLELPHTISAESYTPIVLKSYGASDSEVAAQLNAEVICTTSVPVLSSIYQCDGDDPAHYLVTKDGRAGELPLPYADAALDHAKVKNSHLDLNYSIYSYEVEVAEPVMDPTTGKVLAEAGIYRYFVDMVEFRYLTVFVPNKSV